MQRILTLPSSSVSSSSSSSPIPLTVSTRKNKACFRSRSSSLNQRNNNVSTSTHSPSRRLALFEFCAAIPESHLLGVRASKLLLEKFPMEDKTFSKTVPASSAVAEKNALNWVNNDKRRMLHAVYSVGDLEKTIKFYTECLGMKLLRQRDIPDERYSNAFLGYGPEESNFTVELTYNYGVDKYEIGTGFGHFGVVVEDCAKTINLVKAKGGTVATEPGATAEEGNKITAFVEDSNGYRFELLERGPTPEPLCQVMLRVGDLDRSISFYKKALGMQLLRKTDYPESKCTEAIMGYGPEDKNTVLELRYNYGIKDYDKGNGYTQIAIGTDDVYKSAEVIKLCGGRIIREPGPVPGINTKITACLDPDGWKSVLVDNFDFLKELE